MEKIEVDAKIRFSALVDKADSGVEAGTERRLGAEFKRQSNIESVGPLGCLLERHNGALERGRVNGLDEIGDYKESWDMELLAEI
jgi:hypothetical protein